MTPSSRTLKPTATGPFPPSVVPVYSANFSHSLSYLLRTSESAVEDLSTQLSSTQTQFEHVSDRVRLKLVEQKEKIAKCYARIGELEEELEVVEMRWEEERGRNRVLEGLLGWERGKGGVIGEALSGDGREEEREEPRRGDE